MKDKHFYLLTVSYDGSNFQGWAKQPKQFTVQGYIEEILSKVFSLKINILASSRTDKGVHACDQKFTWRLALPFSEERLLNLLKKALGKHILVRKVQKVDNNFHPIQSVINKEYRYFINTGPYDIFRKNYQ